MLFGDLQTQLQLLVKASAPELISVPESAPPPGGSAEFVPGQSVHATVVAALTNGRFQVLVADHLLDLNLPRNTQPGEKLNLTFISSRPRLTFALSQEGAVPQGGDSQVSMGATAKFIGALLAKMGQYQAAATQGPAKATPVIEGPPGETAVLAQKLSGALSESGLFYESHQAQWVSGERPLSDLLREPQGQLPATTQAAGRAPPPGSPMPAANGQTDAGGKAGMPAARAPTGIPGAATSSARPGAQSAGAQVNAAATKDAQPAHPATIPIVQRQLDALDQRALVWQGQVWPGQTMQWRIEEEGGQGNGPENSEENPWKTHLNLTLPRMGEVNATIALGAKGVRLDVSVAGTRSSEALKRASPALAGALSAAGIPVLSLVVRRREET
ncbi:MAG: flagellar hook-length control protein FliK [Betaproteobacteria bacterium]|nr:flagellar hook-length control protein FliK [Betaproteobacteria bacterium]